MSYCPDCGALVQSDSRYCSGCGKARHPRTDPVHTALDMQVRALPAKKSKKALWLALVLLAGLGIIYLLLNSALERIENAESTGLQTNKSSQDSQAARMEAQQRDVMQKYSFELERLLRQDGYDVTVLTNHYTHTITLTSDSFQDPVLREGVADKIRSLENQLCKIGIWNAEVGYSKGLLSSDVMKQVALNCPEARAARIKATEAGRQELASALSFDSHIKAHVERTTLVFESPEWFDNPKLRAQFLEFTRSEKDKLCAREVTSIRLKGKKYNKIFPVTCN